MNQTRAALTAIAVAIPIGMIATIYTGSGAEQEGNEDGKLQVVASFYPLYEFTLHVAGDKADVSSLVPAGIEPHDWEPTSRDVSRARSADLVVINGGGFESWADQIDAKMLVYTSEGIEFDHGGAINPHIWLDPILAEHQVEKIRDAMGSADLENAGYYNDNAARFTAELHSLDNLIKTELADCAKSDFIAFHDAFTHFAERYGLTQHSVQGASPEGEILPQRIAQVIAIANKLDINVIYSEDLIDSRLAQTIADEIPRGTVLVLSPIEGIDQDEREAGIGYIEKMRRNVENLKVGLECR